MKQLPLYLTLSRIVFTLPIILLAQKDTFWANWIAVVIFIIASFTDFLDGYYARKLNAVSNLGKFLDPVADKILVSSLLILFIAQGKIDLWMAILFIARDTFIGGIRSVASADGVIIDAKATGKWKAALQMCSIPMLILAPTDFFFSLERIGYFLLWFSVGLSLISGYEYFMLYLRSRKKV